MTADDSIGWLAASLTLLTFSMRSMMALRIAAMAANICFIVYGTLSHLYPVVTLHVLLLPCNLFRFYELQFGKAGLRPHRAMPRKAARQRERASQKASRKTPEPYERPFGPAYWATLRRRFEWAKRGSPDRNSEPVGD